MLAIPKKLHAKYKEIMFQGIDLTIPTESDSNNSPLISGLTTTGFLLILISGIIIMYRKMMLVTVGDVSIWHFLGSLVLTLLLLSLSISSLLESSIMAQKGYDRFYKRFFFKSLATVIIGAYFSYSAWVQLTA